MAYFKFDVYGSYYFGFANVENWDVFFKDNSLDTAEDFASFIEEQVTDGIIDDEYSFYMYLRDYYEDVYNLYLSYLAELELPTYEDGYDVGYVEGKQDGYNNGYTNFNTRLLNCLNSYKEYCEDNNLSKSVEDFETYFSINDPNVYKTYLNGTDVYADFIEYEVCGDSKYTYDEYISAINQAKNDAVTEFKLSDDYVSLYSGRYAEGQLNAITEYKKTDAYIQTLEAQKKLGEVEGVTAFKESTEYANSLAVRYSQGYDDGVSESQDELAESKLNTSFVSIFGLVLLVLVVVYFIKVKKKRRS